MIVALRTKVYVISTSIVSQMLVIILSVHHLNDISFIQPYELLSNLGYSAVLGEESFSGREELRVGKETLIVNFV